METRHYELIRIDGEYAVLRDKATGDELPIAMALLPEDADVGVSLVWENLTYTVE